MRFLPAVALLATAACASGSSVGASRPVSTSIGMTGSSDRLTISPSTGPNVNTLAHAADAVWRVLPAAFDSVSVPATRVDARTKTIGNDGFKVRQRLGRTPLSRFMDCGQTQIGPNADSYEVFITLVVQAMPEGTGTKLVTNFEASARPIAFSQGYSRCTSRGALEARLLEAVLAQLK